MKLKTMLALAASAAVVCVTASAAVKPHSLFSDAAVLQQGTKAPIWGTAADGEKVTVSFQGQMAATTAKEGKWLVRLKPLKPGGPFTMTIAGSNKIELKSILVGEVWICSGQSNMAWQVSGTTDAEATIAASGDPQLRLFRVPPAFADTPQADVTGAWSEAGPNAVGGFSAVGYFFGRELREALNVPVGLINTSYGGTRIEAWTSVRVLDEKPGAAAKNQNQPGVLYNAMIAPLIPYSIRGAIWYQGESNAGQAYLYRTRLPSLIGNWREDWGQGVFPFLFVQLAPFSRNPEQAFDSAWAELREAQLLTSLRCPRTGMAVITDVGDCGDIHPKNKAPVGARLALAARAIAYGEQIAYQGPLCSSMMTKGGRAVLIFTNAGTGLKADGDVLKGFAVAGEDKKFYDAEATIRGDKVIVRSPQVPSPVAVRYAWCDCPTANLTDSNGLPASPFRTDDWPMVTAPR